MSVTLDDMNPHVIRDNIRQHIGERVLVKIYGMRNKTDSFMGYIEDVYPQIFTINIGDGVKTISYSELISGEVKVTFV